MSVDDYASRIRSVIRETPHVVSHSLGYEDRPPVAGIVKGAATFADGAVLHFKEFLQLSPSIIRLKYGYDNARDPAARHLPTYPHHKHIRTGLHASSGPTLAEALRRGGRFGETTAGVTPGAMERVSEHETGGRAISSFL